MTIGKQIAETFAAHGDTLRTAGELLPAQHRAPLLPEDDDADLPGASAWPPTQPMLIEIVYVDGKGRRSTRQVTVRAVGRSGGHLYLRGLCHQRGAMRCFRDDRIVEIVTPLDGHAYENAIAFLSDNLLISDDPDPAMACLDAAFACSADIVMVLAFLGRCDGDYASHEQEAIGRVLARRADAIAFDAKAAARRIALLRPDFDDFAGAIERIAAEPDDALELAHAAVEVVQADGIYAPEERRFMQELADILAVAVRPEPRELATETE